MAGHAAHRPAATARASRRLTDAGRKYVALDWQGCQNQAGSLGASCAADPPLAGKPDRIARGAAEGGVEDRWAGDCRSAFAAVGTRAGTCSQGAGHVLLGARVDTGCAAEESIPARGNGAVSGYFAQDALQQDGPLWLVRVTGPIPAERK